MDTGLVVDTTPAGMMGLGGWPGTKSRSCCSRSRNELKRTFVTFSLSGELWWNFRRAIRTKQSSFDPCSERSVACARSLQPRANA